MSVFYIYCLLLYFIAPSRAQGGPANDEAIYVLNFASEVHPCSDPLSETFFDTSGMQVLRVNDSTALMTGEVNLIKGINDQTKVEISVEKEVSGHYQLQFKHEIDFCVEVADPESDIRPYLKYCGFPPECPFEPGRYSINDLIADFNVPIKAKDEGNYLITVTFNHDPGDGKNEKTFLGCLKVDMVVEPLE